MEPFKRPRRPNIRWDTHMRQVLCCLFRFFVRENKKWEEIFSFIFRSRLNECHIDGHVPFATLNTQWVCMRDHGDPVWHHVHMATEFNKDGQWKSIISKINSTAQILRLRIQENDADCVDTSRWGSSALNSAARTKHSSSLVVPVSRPRTVLVEKQPRPFFCQQTTPASVGSESPHNPSFPQLMMWAFNQTEEPEVRRCFGHGNDSSDAEITEGNVSHDSDVGTPLRSSQPVVISHGKVCFWCEQSSVVDEHDDGWESDYGTQNEGDQHHINQLDQEEFDISEHGLNQHGSLDCHDEQTQTRTRESNIIDLTIEDDDDKRSEYGDESIRDALQHDWPSEDDNLDTPTPSRWKDPLLRRNAIVNDSREDTEEALSRITRKVSMYNEQMSIDKPPEIQLLFPDGSWKMAP